MDPSFRFQAYEELLKNKLLPLLNQKREIAQELRSRARELSDALHGIDRLFLRQSRCEKEPCEILADIGSGYRVKAYSSATSAAVNIGLDVFVDMPLEEAANFFKSRFKELDIIAKKAEEEANIVKRDYDSAASAYTTLRSLQEHNA